MGSLSKKKQEIDTEISESSQVYEEEEAKVEEYFGQFY
jgi:hypothetical protein